MRTLLLLAATRLAVALVATCLGPAQGRAQAQLDPRALDELGPAAPQERSAPPVTAAKKPVPPPHEAAARREPADPHAHPNGPHQILPPLPGKAYGGTTVAPALPAVPAAPPPGPVLPPPIVVPTRPPPPPIPPTVVADAPGAAIPTADGLRLTFGSGSADLNPTTEAALRKLAKSAAADGATFSVIAYAAGTPDDPSTARRLSLSRALAVRSVLITSGVPSPRIYVRALGATVPPPPSAPPDRVDIAVTPGAPPSGQSAPPEKAAP
jgi:outer membrane protein OmpA-like peptidoglycan-associated protein